MVSPSGGSKRPGAPSGPIGTTHVPSRSAPPAKQERRRALIISCGMLLVGAVAAVGMVVARAPKAVQTLNSSANAPGVPDRDLRTAKITTDLDGSGCSQQIFDNQSGRVIRSQKPCEPTTYDINGVPVPIGTIHRLDAISKSFAGH